MLRADGHSQRLGGADRELPRKVEIEDRLSVAKAASIKVALALRAEGRVQRVVNFIVEAVVAKTRRKVRVPSRNVAADAECRRIIVEIGLDERQEADGSERDEVLSVRNRARGKDAVVAVGG